ncbi:MAG: NAD(P)H-dependent glycerol-3-phosphate dehydrogenase [Rikenellaceae bacterium]
MAFIIDKQAKCAVIGYGSWATALVKILLENESDIIWHIRNPDVADHIMLHSHNPKYLSPATFDTDKITITDDINFAIDNADIIILAVPSAFLETTLEPLTLPITNKFIISAIKGIIPNGFLTIAEYVNQKYDLPFSQIGVITGPCHAEEVALERLSYLNIVTTHPENCELLASKFRCKYIHINLLSDIYGAEYSAVIKNVYAISVGIAIGSGYGDNFISVLIANANDEINRFLEETYPHKRNTSTSAYLGDLLVTCYSQFSRNRTFGMMVGKGYSVKSAQIEMAMIAEGYWAASCINQICDKKHIDLPIAKAVYAILYERASAKSVFNKLASKLL